MAEMLTAAGYATAAVITNGNASAAFGLDRGFDTFIYLAEERTPAVHVLSDRVNGVALDWLRQRPADRPFFLYLHTSDPHAPYAPRTDGEEAGGGTLAQQTWDMRPGSLATLAEIARSAAAEVAFNDRQFGALLDELARRELLDDTLIVFIADHGEAFGGHGEWQHGTSLYGEQIDIPLLIRFPGGAGGGSRVRRLAGQADVLPTVLESVGLPVPEGLDGVSLLRSAGCAWPQADRALYAFLRLDGIEQVAVLRGDDKLIRNGRTRTPRPATLELYDLATDPAESHPAATAGQLRSDLLGALLARAGAARAQRPAAAAALPAELIERLRALGYLR
jgi:arylsulfatase